VASASTKFLPPDAPGAASTNGGPRVGNRLQLIAKTLLNEVLQLREPSLPSSPRSPLGEHRDQVDIARCALVAARKRSEKVGLLRTRLSKVEEEEVRESAHRFRLERADRRQVAGKEVPPVDPPKARAADDSAPADPLGFEDIERVERPRRGDAGHPRDLAARVVGIRRRQHRGEHTCSSRAPKQASA